MKKFGKIAVLLLAALLIFLFFKFELGQYLTLEAMKENRENFLAQYQKNPILTLAVYTAIYILTTALSLPGAALLTLLGGALFGLLTGTIVVSFASTIGATLAFLASRFILRDWVQEKFGSYLKTINDGIEKDGAFYLFTLRLIPAVPFFVINLAMGLTPMRTLTYFFVSQVGMLAGTAVYVNAGTQLAQIDSLKGILSPTLIFSFVLLGLFPLAAKKIVAMIQKGKKK